MTAPARPLVVLVTLHYAPERNFITTDMARALARDYEVRVITAQPNYPAGKVYDGYAWWRWRTTVEAGVRVTRLPTLTYRGMRVAGRLMNYLGFAAGASIAALLLARRPALWIVYQTPFSTSWSAALGRWLWGGKVVHIVADLWPESMLAAGVLKEGTLSRLVGWSRRLSNRLADHLVITTPGMRPLFVGEGVPDERMSYLPVWTEAQQTLTSPLEGPAPVRGEPPYICYAGTIGPSQGLDTLVTAMGMLQRAGSPIRARIAGAGNALPALQARIAREGITNIDLLGIVPPTEVQPLVRGSLAQVVSLVPDPRFTWTVPSKLFGAIGSGTPILAGLQGDARALAEESGMAFVYRNDDPADLVRAIGEAERLDDAARRRLAAVGWKYYSEALAPAAGLATIEGLVTAMVRPGSGRTTNSEGAGGR